MSALWAPPLTDGETAPERAARYVVLAEAQASAANAVTASGLWPGTEVELAAALVALGWHESGWVLRVHAGRCRSDECDPIRRWTRRGWITVGHAAATPWQLHQTGHLPAAAWRGMIGTSPEATGLAALAAARAFARARNWCRGGQRDWAARAISGYATGRRCVWRGAAARLKTVWRAERAILSASCTAGPAGS